MNPETFNQSSANPSYAGASASPSGAAIPPYNPVPTAPLNPPAPKRASGGASGIIKTVLLIFFVLLSLVAGYFVYYFYSKYSAARADVEAEIATAVAKAEKDKTSELEAEFAEREKNPFSTFSGPSDYGELTFSYPKTWSVYVSKDASKGGDFEAYLNPAQVNPVSNTTVNALRVTISTKTFDTITKTYQGYVTKGTMTAEVKTIGGESATVYKGTLPSKLVGAVAIFKIRDKTALLQTDAELFLDDFNQVLETVKYNL